jgi:hypothetical protein
MNKRFTVADKRFVETNQRFPVSNKRFAVANKRFVGTNKRFAVAKTAGSNILCKWRRVSTRERQKARNAKAWATPQVRSRE